MLFHIRQSHAAQDCPYGKGGFQSLFDGGSKHVTVRGRYLAFRQHTTFMLVEAESVAALQRFLAPGAKVATCEITPVSEESAP